jgi:hypothetical protein
MVNFLDIFYSAVSEYTYLVTSKNPVLSLDNTTTGMEANGTAEGKRRTRLPTNIFNLIQENRHLKPKDSTSKHKKRHSRSRGTSHPHVIPEETLLTIPYSISCGHKIPGFDFMQSFPKLGTSIVTRLIESRTH